MANMVPLNFVQDIFTSRRFMAERIKVITKVAEKIQRGRGLNGAGEKEAKRDEQREAEEEEERIMSEEGGCFPTPRMVKAGV